MKLEGLRRCFPVSSPDWTKGRWCHTTACAPDWRKRSKQSREEEEEKRSPHLHTVRPTRQIRVYAQERAAPAARTRLLKAESYSDSSTLKGDALKDFWKSWRENYHRLSLRTPYSLYVWVRDWSQVSAQTIVNNYRRNPSPPFCFISLYFVQIQFWEIKLVTLNQSWRTPA